MGEGASEVLVWVYSVETVRGDSVQLLVLQPARSGG